MSTRYAYLACPYSSDRDREQERFEEVTKIAVLLASMGLRLYSPITHTHPMHSISPEMHAEISHREWMEMDKPFLMGASLLVVCCMPGWDRSAGIKMEVDYFTRLQKPILYIESDAFRQMQGA